MQDRSVFLFDLWIKIAKASRGLHGFCHELPWVVSYEKVQFLGGWPSLQPLSDNEACGVPFRRSSAGDGDMTMPNGRVKDDCKFS